MRATQDWARLRAWQKAVTPFIGVLMVLLVGGISYYLLRSMAEREEFRLYERVQTVILANRLQLVEEAAESHGRGYLLTRNETFRERFHQTNAEFKATLSLLKLRLDGRALMILGRIEEVEAEHTEELSTIVEALGSGAKLDDVLDDFQLQIRPRRLTLERLFEELSQEATTDFERARGEFLRRAQVAVMN